jgi:radical SAM-linked protein
MASRTPTGPPPPPTVQRLRVRYAKRDRLRFTSHRDFARAFERALRRAHIPMAYSAGFSPHPKVSYAGAAPTGVASEAEYLEIGLAARREPEWVRTALDAALPPGLDVVEVVEASGGALADRIAVSHWRIDLPGMAVAPVQAAVDRLLELETAPVQRMMKAGLRTLDVRPALVHVVVADARPGGCTGPGAPDADPAPAAGACATLEMVVRHTTPAVRPDDVLTALRTAAGLTTPVTPRVTRLAQGQLDETLPGDAVRLHDPLGDLVD